MSKKLLIVRHAKSDWSEPGIPDHDRPLNKRGQADAPKMAKRLAKKDLIPELLVSSPAKRAIRTAEYFAEGLDLEKKKIQKEHDIYEATSASLLKIINKLDDRYKFVAIFGHNPGLSMLVSTLCDKESFDMPTCAMALIEFPFKKWEHVSEGTGDLEFYDYPKNVEKD